MPAVSTRATDHDVVVQTEVPEEAPASPSASPKEDGDDDGTLNAHTAKDASRETHDASLSEDADADATNEPRREDEASTNEASTNEASTNEASTHEPHVPPIQGSNLEKKKRTVLLTWGSAATASAVRRTPPPRRRASRRASRRATRSSGPPPPGTPRWSPTPARCTPPSEDDSAGGGGHGPRRFPTPGSSARGGSTNAFEMVPTPAGAFATQVACGRYHTAAVTAEGGVLTFGLNDRGQLGRAGVFGDPDLKKACGCDSAGNCACAGEEGEGEDKTRPTSYGKNEPCRGGWACRDGVARFTDLGLDPVTREPRAASFVAAGRYSTAVVTKSGDVVIWGLNACGGAFDDVTENENETDAPQTVASFLDRLVNDAAFRRRRGSFTRRLFRRLGGRDAAGRVRPRSSRFLTSRRARAGDTGRLAYAGGWATRTRPTRTGGWDANSWSRTRPTRRRRRTRREQRWTSPKRPNARR